MIQIERLTKTYGKARGVTELTLRVPEGSCYGFIGPNGAGKSTTIRTLLGLLAPTAGSARVLGLDCRRERRAILAQVGYMPSEAMFYPNMRVEEVIRFSASLRKQDCRAEADALCQALDLDGRKRIRELSLGNRKKVSIVCAMQHRPRLYVLDEPTSGLDPLAQRTFWSLLEGRRQEGATVFLSSHVLSEIQRQCSRAAIIREGRLLREGAVAELTGAGTRRVTLRGGELPSQLPGAADLRREGDTASFLYSGSVDSLLEALRGRHLADLHITEPDLEEIFLHYYEGGDGQ
jgi:ABC-2 type transport system ATP-binding protein